MMREVSETTRARLSAVAHALHRDPVYRANWLPALIRATEGRKRRNARARARAEQERARLAMVALADHPALKREKTREALEAVAAAHGVPVWRLIGRHRDARSDAVAARRDLFARLYEPPGKKGFHSFRYGVAELARVFGFDWASVIHALRRAGVWRGA